MANDSDFFHHRKVLVTGGSGLIGSAFVGELLDRGALVHAVVHRRPIPFGADVRVRVGDLRSWAICRAAARGMDCVIQAAGVSGGSKKVTSDALSMFTDSLVMNTQMLEAARIEGVGYYLLVSNSSVYSRSDQALREEEAWGRTSVGIPENETGMVKRAGETQCGLYAKMSDMHIAIIRAGNAYGPHDNFDLQSSHVAPALIRRAVERQNPLRLWGDGTPKRDFIHSADIARGGLFVLGRVKPHQCEPVNIATGRTVTIRELADLTLRLAGHSEAEIRFEHTAPLASASKRLDVSRMRSLGFEPGLRLEEGLRQTIEWYRGHAEERAVG